MDDYDVINIAIALVKDREYNKANKLIIDKMNEVLGENVKSSRAKVKELNKSIFFINITIDKYISKLEEIKTITTSSEGIQMLEKSIKYMENERGKKCRKKYNISF